MRIGVKVPVDRDLLEVGARELVGDRLEIVIEPRERRDLGDLYATHAVGREDALRRVRLDHARNEEPRELGERAPERRSVAGVDAGIQLVREDTTRLRGQTR